MATFAGRQCIHQRRPRRPAYHHQTSPSTPPPRRRRPPHLHPPQRSSHYRRRQRFNPDLGFGRSPNPRSATALPAAPSIVVVRSSSHATKIHNISIGPPPNPPPTPRTRRSSAAVHAVPASTPTPRLAAVALGGEEENKDGDGSAEEVRLGAIFVTGPVRGGDERIAEGLSFAVLWCIAAEGVADQSKKKRNVWL